MSWIVELVGTQVDLDDIRDGVAGMAWQVIDREGKPYLTSLHLDSSTSVEEAVSQAEAFLDTLDGALKLIHRDHRLTSTGTVIHIRDDGSMNTFLRPEPAALRVRVRGGVILLGGQPQPTNYQRWLDVAEREPAVRDALHFFKQPTWWNLYKAYEVIRQDVGGDHALKETCFVPGADLGRFTGTAQSRTHLGDDARHGVDPDPPIPNPMTLHEAQTVIERLIRAWIDAI